MAIDDSAYDDNFRLGQAEYLLQHIYLHSRPRCLGLVIGNTCNLSCIHCYQAKNGDNLLRPLEIGEVLRREFIGLYPFLSTLRVHGGEVFVIPGFRELLDDVAATVGRPIVSISTNGTLIDDRWAETIVRTPFQSVTFSIDAATPQTYARLRRGGKLEDVLAAIERIEHWKKKLGTSYPYLDSFFVVMRSNFREIPRFLELMKNHGVPRVALQPIEINLDNSARYPALEAEEAIVQPAEVAELHALLRDSLATTSADASGVNFSGLTTLFSRFGLDCAFLNEDANGLYPDSEGLNGDTPVATGFELCPNPWTTLFVTEAGAVHLCFLSQPIGNLYEQPLADIWNSPAALAKRSRMVAGRYLESGCSGKLCSWRQGGTASACNADTRTSLLARLRELRERRTQLRPVPSDRSSPIPAVRRLLLARNRRIAELEPLVSELQAELGHYTSSRLIRALVSVRRRAGQLLRGFRHPDFRRSHPSSHP